MIREAINGVYYISMITEFSWPKFDELDINGKRPYLPRSSCHDGYTVGMTGMHGHCHLTRSLCKDIAQLKSIRRSPMGYSQASDVCE